MSVETTRVETSKQTPTHEEKKTQETKVETKAKKPVPLFGSLESRERLYEAEGIIRRNTLWALGAGALIFPGVDIVASLAVQLKMLKNLADLYDVKFSEGIAKKLVGSLVMSLGGLGVGLGAASLLKAIPGVGSVLGIISFPLSVAAFTHALGRVFLMHFESGGTLLNFDPKAMQGHFKSEFERARQTVEQLKKESKTETTQRTEHPVA